MPKTSQGNIFEATERAQYAIVFGHIGFNEMSYYWNNFRHCHRKLQLVRDPFKELEGNPFEWSSGKWLQFFSAQDNHGMTESQVASALGAALEWASRNDITSVVTNGIANTDIGRNTASNRRSNVRRAAWLHDYASRLEQEYNITIQLISLNDIFVCGFQSG